MPGRTGLAHLFEHLFVLESENLGKRGLDAMSARIHLNNGKLLGGYWGGNSYAGSFPNDGDIYLEAVYSVDDAGHFGEVMPNSRGVLLRKDQYSYIELFSAPSEELSHAKE